MLRATIAWGLALVGAGAAAAGPLYVVTTVPDLASLTREIGGEEVEVTSLVRGPQDAHFVDPRPSFVRKLHDADLYLEMGLDLESGWAPLLLRGARNPAILPGGRGYLNASTAIRPLQVPGAGADRSMGDIHVYGNPHFLVDPLNGLLVAGAIRDKLVALRPAAAAAFRARHDDFEQRLTRRLEAWQQRASGLRGLRAVEDHQAWLYFARRFGLELVATLEPKPGIAPTTGHLGEVVEIVQAQKARVILASPYFDPRYARWVEKRTGARVAPLAHQVDSREGTGDYLSMIEYNVNSVLAAARE